MLYNTKLWVIYYIIVRRYIYYMCNDIKCFVKAINLRKLRHLKLIVYRLHWNGTSLIIGFSSKYSQNLTNHIILKKKKKNNNHFNDERVSIKIVHRSIIVECKRIHTWICVMQFNQPLCVLRWNYSCENHNGREKSSCISQIFVDWNFDWRELIGSDMLYL